MENRESESPEKKTNNRSYREKAFNYRFAFFVVLGILLISVLFSGIQSLYIFRLNNGLEGVLSYTRNVDQTATGTNPTSAIESLTDGNNLTSKNLPEPWFSLEEASMSGSSDKTKLSIVEIVEKVSPATVPLSIMGIDDGKEKKISSGTGFIISEDGYIVTNAHVVEMVNGSTPTYYAAVLLPDETQLVKAEIVGSDKQTDIAVLKVETDKKLPCVTLGDSDTLQAGELAVVIGNAMGTLDDTVTVGVISAPSRVLNRNGYYVDIIQTDAAINPGNSGGPVINSFGEVIGITNAKILTSTSENLGFAIPINSVKKIIEDLINYGKVVGRPYLGVSVKYVSADAYYGAKGGVYVAELVRNSPADVAGFVLGDRIIKMDGVEINEAGDIIKVRDAHEVGDVIEFVIDRDGEEITIPLTIGDSADF